MKKIFVLIISCFLTISLFGCTKNEQPNPTIDPTPSNVETYTVNFDSDGGSKVDSIKVEKGKELKLPENPTKQGYAFVTWIDDQEMPYYDGALLDVESELNLKAIWIKSLTINFDTDGGSTVNSIVLIDGELFYSPETPTKDGYTFICWQDSNETPILDEALLSVWDADELTLYAKWSKN